MERGLEEIDLWVLGKGEMGLIVKLDWEMKGLEKLGMGFEREEEIWSNRGERDEDEEEEEEKGKAKLLNIVEEKIETC